MMSMIRTHTSRRAARRSSRAGAAVLAGALALSLAACGGDAEPGAEEPAPPPAATATPADDPGPTEEPTPDDGAPSTLEELNALLTPRQLEAGSVRTEATFGGGAAELAGLAGVTMASDVIFAPDGTAQSMHLAGTVDGQTLDMLFVDDMFYVNLGEASGGMFMSMTRDEMAADPAFADLLGQFDSPNTGAVQQFASDAVTSFEHTTGDGTDIFTIGLDPSQLSEAELAQASVDPAAAEMIEEMTLVMVVSQAEGLPQSATISITMSGETLDVITAFSQWGQISPITAPPAEMVIPYADVTPE